jgi:hypothetical protein
VIRFRTSLRIALMPFYRTALGMVHMRGTRMPAPCAAHFLVRDRQEVYAAWSTALCDGKDIGRRSGACDAPICDTPMAPADTAFSTTMRVRSALSASLV